MVRLASGEDRIADRVETVGRSPKLFTVPGLAMARRSPLDPRASALAMARPRPVAASRVRRRSPLDPRASALAMARYGPSPLRGSDAACRSILAPAPSPWLATVRRRFEGPTPPAARSSRQRPRHGSLRSVAASRVRRRSPLDPRAKLASRSLTGFEPSCPRSSRPMLQARQPLAYWLRAVIPSILSAHAPSPPRSAKGASTPLAYRLRAVMPSIPLGPRLALAPLYYNIASLYYAKNTRNCWQCR